MSQDLSLHIYPKTTEFNCIDTFWKLIKAVNEWSSYTSDWHGLNITQFSPYREYRSDIKDSQRDSKTRLNKFTETINQLDVQSDYKISLATSYPYHQTNSGNKPKKHFGSLSVYAWGAGQFRGHYPLEEGLGKISFNPVQHFFFQPEVLVRDDEDISKKEESYLTYKKCVLRNLENIRNLFDLLITHLDPFSIKLYLGSGARIPFNSHATYFSSHESLMQDLSFIRDTWSGENPIEDTPLNRFDPVKHKWFFNQIRPKEQSRELWEDMSRLLPSLDKVTPDVVKLVWDQTNLASDEKLDIKRIKAQSVIVFNSPFFLNTFVSRYYLDVLEMAALESEDN
ncbi:hypothetical protein [Gimesia sp.]|uniref:hypothetical protein n=1 Tax=Gimesia sp. TaxID=2024833 RepID=UPI0032F08B70